MGLAVGAGEEPDDVLVIVEEAGADSVHGLLDPTAQAVVPFVDYSLTKADRLSWLIFRPQQSNSFVTRFKRIHGTQI